MRRRAALAFALAAAALPAAAQERTAAERQTLVELAYVLGEAHALRVACEGRSNQAWRNRMARVIELEAAEDALKRRLMDRFNTGYLAQSASHTACTDAAKNERRRVAARGRELSLGLAQSQAAVEPVAMAGAAAVR